MKRHSAGGDFYDISDPDSKFLSIATPKLFLVAYTGWNAFLALLFLVLSFWTTAPISAIFTLPFIGTCFISIFAIRMRSKMIFAFFAIYTIIGLWNSLFKLCIGLGDGDWFDRSFYGPVESFQSIISIIQAIFQFTITIVLIKISFCEMRQSVCCCKCCFLCCCCCPCFVEKREEKRMEQHYV